MSWRDFLVFADESEDGLARMRMAMAIAEAHQGHLEAVMLAPTPAGALGAGPEALGLYKEAHEAARAAAANGVAALRAVAGAGSPAGVSVHAWEVSPGEERDAAARAARTSDLVIFGKPETLDNSELDTDIFIGAIMEGGRPCLMLPRWITPHAWGKRALIAWKGTPEAARAVQGALPFLKAAEIVRVCVANPKGEREGEDERSLQRLATYLIRHGVKVEETIARTSWEGSERMVVSEVEGFNADLLVLGAYEGSRITEDLFGGVTATMVRDATIPVLMAH